MCKRVCVYLFLCSKKNYLNPPHYLNEDGALKIFQKKTHTHTHAYQCKAKHGKEKRQENREIKYSNQNVCEYIKWNLMKMSFYSMEQRKEEKAAEKRN